METRKIDQSKMNSPWSVFKTLFKRISLVISFCLILLFFFTWKTENVLARKLRSSILDICYPALASMTSFVDASYEFVEYSKIFFTIKDENQNLKAKIQQLEGEIEFSKKFEKENQELKKLLKFVEESEFLFKSAKVIGSSNNSFIKSILIDIGLNEGAQVGQAVVNHHGVVGRIIEVGDTHSRVLLVTDYNSKIPVIGMSSREHAILYGQNDDLLKLSFYEKNHDFEIGETLITSGDGGLFPPGYPIATIVDIEENRILATSVTKWSLIDFVSVLYKN